MEEKFSTFEIEHTPRNENWFADALATLGSQIMFKGDNTRVVVSKRKESIIEMLKERFQEEQCEGDWRFTIREALMKEEDAVELKVLKDYALVRGELYRRMPGGILTYGSCGEVNLYCRLQRTGFYWPSMGKDINQVQTQCGTCQLAANRAESYAVFASKD